MEGFFILALLILIFSIGFIGFYLFRLKRRIDLFFQKGNKDLGEFLSSQAKKLEKQEADLKKVFKDISRLDKISELSFQKIGLVRFNPFRDVGGDQSFSIALLDLRNNGFIITSIYGREGNRIYSKAIKDSKSEYSLSEEEKEAIKKAIG